MLDSVSRRKVEHLDIAIKGVIESPKGAGWGDIQLVHNCLPEVNLTEVDLSVDFMGHRLQAPIMIAAMTGGHPESTEVNRRLASAAEYLGIALGMGSQRAIIEDPELLSTYTVARTVAPRAFIVANIGAAQLTVQANCQACTVEQIVGLVDAISADALAVHLNFLQEACQAEGDTMARGCSEAIKAVCQSVPIPVIAKETGSGIGSRDAERLRDLGVQALDVGGYGGSNMALMEAHRAERHNDALHLRLGETFASWGTPTPVVVVEAQAAGLPVIATGGIRSGLDAAKALNLGAKLVGIGQPALVQAEAGEEELVKWLEGFVEELRVATFLTGATNVAELCIQPRRVFGRTAEWLRQWTHR